jgi:hypothetical protein
MNLVPSKRPHRKDSDKNTRNQDVDGAAMAKNIGISELEEHVGYWLRFVSNRVSYAFMQTVEAKGVTVAEWAVMREMLEAGPVNPSRLAERFGMTRGWIPITRPVHRAGDASFPLPARGQFGRTPSVHTVAHEPLSATTVMFWVTALTSTTRLLPISEPDTVAKRKRRRRF